ncbi:glucosamine-6-phosphate deaminase [Acetonema longum]|uniref:Glucosamine-6-phosphate deaminase n=1 Tax=Acetonema longum DSM 6540 TaxID=1009370 RepID=F7NJ48_9FIRM|nr:glucosamine-6-phosphate deaminase [Acetonema longum]EGO63938.1 glucosamine-6-phosphate isomerase [Acetonema longum DSM 6540]
MRIIIAKNYEELSKQAANLIASQIFLNPRSVLGLATGSTPLMTYAKLIERYHQDGLDFSQITTFNLDEYVGLPKNDPQSYHYYMRTHFFQAVNLKEQRIHIPDGMAPDLEVECAQYEAAIERAGGIDLQLLGIGNNGHIGFNEPDFSFEATTHVVELDNETIQANSRFFQSPEAVPRRAISMGIKTIMRSRIIVLLASGQNKAAVVAKALYGEITPAVPASILQLHPNVIVVVDQEAAQHLPDRATSY